MLRLDYYGLKKRVEATRGRPDSPGPAFLELPAAISGGREYVLEFEDGAGVCLRVHLKGYDATQVVAVARRVRDCQ